MSVTITITAEQYAILCALGGGVAYKGLEELIKWKQSSNT